MAEPGEFMTFEEWKTDLESRRIESKFAPYGGATERFEIVKANNIRTFDRQLKILALNGIACAHCHWPLPSRDNFRIYLYGDVCTTCFGLHTIVAASPYFVAISKKENDKEKPKGFDGWFYDDEEPTK